MAANCCWGERREWNFQVFYDFHVETCHNRTASGAARTQPGRRTISLGMDEAVSGLEMKVGWILIVYLLT
jgi:hypothetical protein